MTGISDLRMIVFSDCVHLAAKLTFIVVLAYFYTIQAEQI